MQEVCGTRSWFISSSHRGQDDQVEQNTRIDVEASVKRVWDVQREVDLWP
jgi:hypothetical protein